MALLAAQLLHSQRLTHMAACAERELHQRGFATYRPVLKQIEDIRAEARELAGNFAAFVDYHPAANDEPPSP
ncbi:hypothetical protein LJR130_003815 [Variovorax sp. LjRoot130]|uniref:hypothetical protein n=1 Tax=unclassified Variovorax TaxID=663243 RepID=UPI003ECE8EFC